MKRRALARIDTNSSLASTALDDLAQLHLWANAKAEQTVRAAQGIDPATSTSLRREYLNGVLHDLERCGDDVIVALRDADR